MSEPKPGVASWFMRKLLRAVLRLGTLPAEDVLIRVEQGHQRNRHRYKHSHATGQQTTYTKQAHHEHERKCYKPMFPNHPAAELHCVPEIQAAINDQRNRENPRDGQVNP